MSLISDFTKGLAKENPTFRLLLGMCPTMAVSLSVSNGIGMGLAATAVLVGSNLIVSLMRKAIPDKVRIPCYVVVIATFVTVVDMIMKAYTPKLSEVLGIFVPLIVVNCIILARAEAFASKNPVANSVMDGLGIGLGFTIALALLGTIREILGTGVIFNAPDFGFDGFRLFPEEFSSIMVILPPGGFITLGLVLGLINRLTKKSEGGCCHE